MKSLFESKVGRFGTIIAVFVVVMAVIGIGTITLETFKGAKHSIEVHSAAELARQKIEHLESLDSLPELPLKETESGLRGKFERLTYVIDKGLDPSLPDGFCRVDVIVSWNDRDGKKQSANYTALLVQDREVSLPMQSVRRTRSSS